MVTVVDAVNLTKDFASRDFLADRGETAGEEDARTLVNLLTEQIESADVVVLNKITDAGPEKLRIARQIVKALNPDAQREISRHWAEPRGDRRQEVVGVVFGSFPACGAARLDLIKALRH